MDMTIEQTLQEAIEAHKAGNLQDAEVGYRAVLEIKPNHPDANHNLGVLAVSMNKPEVALPLFKIALETNPNQGQFWISYVDALIKDQQFDNAKSILEQGKKKGLAGERVDRLTQQLTLTVNKQGNKSREEKKQHLVAAPIQTKLTQKQGPSQADIDHFLKRLQKQDHRTAKKLATSITQKFPQHPLGWKMLGVALKQLGELSEAVIANQKAVVLAPTDPEAHYNLSNRLREIGRLEDSVAGYRKATELKPDYVEAHYNLSITLQELGRLEDAEISYKKAIVIKPDYLEAHNNLGITLKAIGRLDEAETSYKKAIAIKPDYAEAHNNLGIMLQELGRLEDAETSYKKVIAIEPAYAEAHNNLGIALKELGRLDEAETSYRKAIAIKPDYAEAHNNLGITLQELSRLEDAETSYKKVIAIEPAFAEAHNNLGITLRELGNLEEAEASYRNAIAIKPEYVEAHGNLGNVLQELGRREEAVNSYRKALDLRPDYTQVNYSLGVLLCEHQQYKQAAQLLKLSNFKNSQSYLLRCLYFLNEQSLFDEQLNYLLKLGESNAMIGSLTSHAAIRYGTVKQNLFCSDPLKYVLTSDLTKQYDFSNTFVRPAITILNSNRTRNRVQEHLINGRQTSGNLFALESDVTHDIKKIIHSEIEKYRNYYKDSEEGLIRNWPIHYSLHGWLVSMKNGGKIRPHMHEHGWISGTVYINVPPKSNADSGNLVVSVGDDEYLSGGDRNSKSIIDVVTGSLCLFPASLIHYTIPFESEEERIVLAFDVLPK